MLKNKKEREDFLKNYQEWEVIYDLAEIAVKIYKKVLATGGIIYATEYQNYVGWKKEFKTEVEYHLVLGMKDEFMSKNACGYDYHVTYEPCGDSMGTIVDYLTKNRDLV